MSMTNALEELKSMVNLGDIESLIIYRKEWRDYDDPIYNQPFGDLKKYIIIAEFQNDAFPRVIAEQFIKLGNHMYDDGFGGQELFGVVWLKDGSWLERQEYDGSEWWSHKSRPSIDKVFDGIHENTK